MKRSHENPLPIRSKLIPEESIGRICRVTSLKKYTGVIMNYVHSITNMLQSEGKQASERSHAYKDYFEEQLARKHVTFPRRGKFRKLVPILRILDELLTAEDYQGVRMLATVMRIHELSKPNKKFLNSELVKFVNEHIVNIRYRSSDITAAIPMDCLKADSRYPLRIVHDESKHYPDFPWREFKDWLHMHIEEDFALARECAGEPPESASIFSKSSPSKFAYQKDGRTSLKSATGSGAADLELAWRLLAYPIDDWKDGDPAINLGRRLLSHLGKDQSFSYEKQLDLIKDAEGLNVYLNESFRYASFGPVEIEASRDSKGRTVHKTAYPINYPLQYLHEIMMRILRRIPGSYAHDHDAGFKEMNRLARSAKYLSGIDAKNWTDWMPLALQFFVLANYVGADTALMWVKLMREPAVVRVTYPDMTQEVIVGQIFPGQAMGGLSSWAVATVTHHKLYRFSCWRILKNPFVEQKNKQVFYSCRKTVDPYGIVGDDEFCTNSQVQAQYILYSDSLGIKMSAQKCKTAIPDEGTYLMEFVHRQTLQGIEVTGLSPILAVEAFASYENLASFLEFCRHHGFELDEDQLMRTLRRDAKSLTKKDYIRKYGCKPINASWIDIGLRIPSWLGGLRSNELNWNTYVEPDFALVVMVARMESTIQVYRTMTTRNREFTRRNEDLILRDLERLPEDLINIDQSTVARYLRRNFRNKTNNALQRHVMGLIETFLQEISQTIQEESSTEIRSFEDYEDIHKWMKSALEQLQTIVGVPTYLAAEAEKAITRSTMQKIVKLSAMRNRDDWSDRLVKRLTNLEDSIRNHGWDYFEFNKASHNKELGAFYNSLFSGM